MHRPVGRRKHAENELEQRGFSAAVGSDDPHIFPAADRKRDAFKYALIAICECELANVDENIGFGGYRHTIALASAARLSRIISR